jgi:hypothetical protein
MMNVYIGKALSNIVIVTQRAPPGVIKPPPEKLAATSINKPPKSQTPASNAGTTGICAVTWPDSFTTKNVINIIKGTHDRDDAYVPSVELGTPQSVDEYIRQPEGSRADQHQFQKARPVYR